jgi:aminoglycoside phosphotransferase (APT) family kinase protein
MTEPAQTLDLDALAAWMDDEGLPAGPIEAVEPLVGGTQNVLVRFDRGGSTYVLRRGPWHLRPFSNEAMRREMRVLEALAGSDVPHPRLIAACPSEDVLGGGAAFYLMESIDGFNPTVALPELHANDAAVRHAMGLSVVDAIAALGAVDHEAAGLTDLGKPDGFLERQVPRWLSELESYGRHEGYPGPDIAGLEEVATWLEPEQGLVSGAVGLAGGLPTGPELVARYAGRTTRDLSAIGWYEVLACFKLGIVLEGTHARAFAGKAPVEVGDLLHATTLALFTRAQRRIHGE